MNTVGRNIAKLLKQRKLSGKEFAALLGLGKSGPSQVSKWVSGTQEPRASALLRIARVLQVPVEKILSDELDEVETVKEIFNNLEDSSYVSLLDGTYRVHLKIEKKINTNTKEGKKS